ncbi:DUF1801 domain-containing protein [Sphingomonas sp.]|uniref:DUF1801 domain-containing protein n=1 Tax=Sphingomonas sp. TaxID=28214 RepID=UPI00286D65F7|nr:DUF1801 domain-containing protein [Sphingomonas sp.]
MVSSKATTIADYLAELALDRAATVSAMRDLVNGAIPDGYDEVMRWGMISWEIPIEVSGPTYNGQPLSYVALAAQKNGYSLYLNCAACSPDSVQRLQSAAAAEGHKVDMGKSCIRFKRLDQLPLDAIGNEIGSTSPADYLATIANAK